jgi:hypothetical protein
LEANVIDQTEQEIARNRTRLLNIERKWVDDDANFLDASKAIVNVRSETLWQEALRPFCMRYQNIQRYPFLFYGHGDIKDLITMTKTYRIEYKQCQELETETKFALIAIEPTVTAPKPLFQMLNRACCHLVEQGDLIMRCTLDLMTLQEKLAMLSEACSQLCIWADPASPHYFIIARGVSVNVWLLLLQDGVEISRYWYLHLREIGLEIEKQRLRRQEVLLWVCQQLKEAGVQQLTEFIKTCHADQMLRKYLLANEARALQHMTTKSSQKEDVVQTHSVRQ